MLQTKFGLEDGSVQKAHGFGAFESNVRQRAVCQKKIERICGECIQQGMASVASLFSMRCLMGSQ